MRDSGEEEGQDDEPLESADDVTLVDIGAVEEAGIKFVETPFSIAARLAADRKRNRPVEDDVEREPKSRRQKPKPTALPPAASSTSVPSKSQAPATELKTSSTKPAGSLAQAFQRQSEIALARPPPPLPKPKAKRPKKAIPDPVMEPLKTAAPAIPRSFPSQSGGERMGFRTAASDLSCASTSSRSASSTPRPFTPLRPLHSSSNKAADPIPRPTLLPFIREVVPSSPSPPSSNHPHPHPTGFLGMYPRAGTLVDSRDGCLIDTASNPSSDSPQPQPQATYFSSPPQVSSYSSRTSHSRQPYQSIVAPRLSLSTTARFSSDPDYPEASFDNTNKVYNASSSLPPLPPPPVFYPQNPIPLPTGGVRSSPVSSSPNRRQKIPVGRLRSLERIPLSPTFPPPTQAPRKPRPSIPKTSGFGRDLKPSSQSSPRRRPNLSPPAWSTLSKNVLPVSSHYGSSVDGPSATSAIATKFSLPGIGGPALTRGRMAFKPKESIGEFKARTAAENGSGGEEKLSLGIVARSVKPGAEERRGPGGGGVGRTLTEDEKRLRDLYRSFD
ncbi:hypothetical protein P7C70_g7397, partial [Phenoliferia sp. Uapishka_3]